MPHRSDHSIEPTGWAITWGGLLILLFILKVFQEGME
jgi:hypothetical protein